MNFKIFLSLLVVVCVASAAAEDTAATEAADTSTVVSTHVVTIVTTSAGVTSTEHATTAETTATGSTGPVSTSHPEVPTTHPTEAPTTTEKPSDIWGVRDGNGSYCILLRATISIKFRYNSTKTHQFVTNATNVPTSAAVNGSCEAKVQWIQLSFFKDWSLKMVFQKKNDSSYYQSDVELMWAVDNSTFADAPRISGLEKHLAPMFNTSKTGYTCLARLTLYENTSAGNDLYGIYTEKLQLEAFQVKHDRTFSEQHERCKEDTISNLVPIIVGACLGGLIIIVLIAYLIGRKRSRRGYESV